MFGGFNIITFSPWVVLIFILFVCFGCLDVCIVAYIVAVIHELGHLLASKIFKYDTSGIKFEPFGVCLSLNNRISSSIHEFVISIAGPFMNFLMIAFGTACAYAGMRIPKAFFISNLYMLFINLLPVMPLDGGRIIMSILQMEIGEKKAKKILKYISAPVICILAMFGMALLFKSKMNASLLVASLFMCNNIKTAGNKSLDIISLYGSEITCDRAKVFLINENTTVKEVIKVLPFDELNVSFVVSGDGRIIKAITNKYIIGVTDDNYLNRKISDI